MIELDQTSRIYVDTNIWIYYIEAKPDLWPRVDAFFEKAEAARAALVTNEIAIAECLVKPSRQGEHQIVDLYETFFASGEIEITALNGELARRAALATGTLGLKLIDAIHYLSALEADCNYLLTADGHFKSGPRLQVISIFS
jgi:predicted nucleic acid-binding protein